MLLYVIKLCLTDINGLYKIIEAYFIITHYDSIAAQTAASKMMNYIHSFYKT